MSIMNCCFCGTSFDTDFISPDTFHIPNEQGGTYVSCGCVDGEELSQHLTDFNIDHVFEAGD